MAVEVLSDKYPCSMDIFIRFKPTACTFLVVTYESHSAAYILCVILPLLYVDFKFKFCTGLNSLRCCQILPFPTLSKTNQLHLSG